MRHPRTLALLAVASAALAGSACTIPRGSMARPVRPAGEGSSMIAAGAMIPFAVAGSASIDDDSGSFSATADNVAVIPAGSFDYALGDRHYIGFDVSVWDSALVSGVDDGDDVPFGLFVNPRWEYGMNDYLSLTVDGNLGYFSADDSGAPFIAPTVGIRAYLPTGFGGAVFSQQVGTAFVTATLPGSLAYDIPIPLGGDAELHVFPELRWDPTFFFIGDDGAVLAFFSGGLSVMLEL